MNNFVLRSPQNHNIKGFTADDAAMSISSLKKISLVDTGHDYHAGCCGGHHHEDAEITVDVKDASTHSWGVVGMDCGSCARKVETAVSRIEGVEQANILFATEKLIVKSSRPNIAELVEKAVIGAGFTLKTEQTQQANPSEPLTLKVHFQSLVKANAQLTVVTVMMLFGMLVGTVSPSIAQWVYTITCLLGIAPVGKKAWQLARSGTPFAIETLMVVAAIGALYLGETAEAAMVLILFMLGERLEAYAASRARQSVKALMALVPESATKVVNGKLVEVATSTLQPQDIIEISAGGRLPADGVLLHSAASFDESALTGESLPVEKQVGDKLMAGSVVADRTVQIEITSKQGESAVDRILHLIEEADLRKAPLERFIDKFSRWYTPAMMLMSLLVIVMPPMLFNQLWDVWLYRGLTLLLIACPCALVISTPAAITSGLATAAKRGALIKGGAALEQLGRVDTIAFDKTGTITQGTPTVTDVVPLVSDCDLNIMLAHIAAIEAGSSHPLAKSLVKYVSSMGIDVPIAENKIALIGVGITGKVEGIEYEVLAPRHYVGTLTPKLTDTIKYLEKQGKTTVVVNNLTWNQAVAVIAWQDTLREDAEQAIAKLKALGVNSIMLTGDNQTSAQVVADRIGIDYRANLLPIDKVDYIEQLSHDKQVAMVGDGINDAPAMRAASIGIAVGSGTDVALEVADAALTHSRLLELPTMIELSRATLTNVHQNVALAIGLKGVFLITTLLGMTGLWVAVLADSGATALVTLNALRLLKFKSTA